MTFAWIIGILIVLLVLAGFLFIAPYNGFVRQRNTIQESWRQVDVELNRRYELIPNLVETVRAYAAHERNTLEEITRLRSQAVQAAQSEGATPSQQRVAVEEQLTGAVRNLLVSVESYPELRSNQNFVELQRALTETEDRIAAGRRYYNANVRAYNTRIESVPSNLVANMFGFEKASYFEVNDPTVRQTPEVNFGEISYRGDADQPRRSGVDALGAAPGNELPNPASQQSQNPYQAQDYLAQGQPAVQYQPAQPQSTAAGQPAVQYQPTTPGQPRATVPGQPHIASPTDPSNPINNDQIYPANQTYPAGPQEPQHQYPNNPIQQPPGQMG